MPLVFYLLTIVLLLISLRAKKKDGFLDKNSSNVIKGFFILLIVYSHILNSFPYNGFLATPLSYFRIFLGQLLVTMFFFISGYGIVVSIEEKGKKYAKSIITNRFMRILLYATLSLVPYFIYSTCLSGPRPIGDYFLALVGLVSFGNSTWFLFAIMVCYLVSAIVAFFFYKHQLVLSILVTVGLIAYIFVMYCIKQPAYTWNTIVGFSFGMFACVFKNKISYLLSRTKLVPFILMIFSVLVVVILQYFANSKYSSHFPEIGIMWFTNFFFCLFFVCLTKVFTLKSRILEYLGSISFAIFMMHRIVLCCFNDFGTIPYEWINYLVLFVTAVVVGIPFYYSYKIIDKTLINPIVQWNRNAVKG